MPRSQQKSDYDRLKSLMASKKGKEKPCREYLPLANELLAKFTSTEFKGQDEELPSRFGPSDYLVICTRQNVAGEKEDHAYLWEVKAPQCPVCARDTKMRARPSRDLINAENQLLHYYDSVVDDGSLLRDHNLSPGRVHLGGIIIGKRSSPMTGILSPGEKLAAARAFSLREKWVYGPAGIDVVPWDRILDYLLEHKPVTKNVTRKKIPINLNTSPDNIIIQDVAKLSVEGHKNGG